MEVCRKHVGLRYYELVTSVHAKTQIAIQSVFGRGRAQAGLSSGHCCLESVGGQQTLSTGPELGHLFRSIEHFLLRGLE